MPIGRQSNALFHTLITFVALFLAATTFAVTYYIKAAKQSAAAATAKAQLGELASTREIQEIGSVVGAKQGGKSRFGTMVGYFNETVAAIIGGLPDDNSMENKTAAVKRKIAETFKQIGQEAADINDPNTAGLIPVIEKMKARMDEATALSTDISQQLEDLRARFDDASAANAEKEKTLLEEKQKNQQQVADIAKDYNDLKVLVEQSSEQRIKTLMNQLDEEKTTCKTLNSKLLKTEAELKLAQERIKTIQENLQKVVPPPDSEVAAFKTDGKIMLVDDSTQTVHLNIGSDDHVYKGLTFSVYDRNAPIPKDGKGKAEIEVFEVSKDTSIAKIRPVPDYQQTLNTLLSESTNASNIIPSLEKPPENRSKDFEAFAENSPKIMKILADLATAYDMNKNKKAIVTGDIAANLIWDSSKENIFTVVGDFDLDGDGNIEPYGKEKVKTLVEKWGGKTRDDVSVDTDFVVLGQPPKVLQKPTFEEMQIDPEAMNKYEASLKKSELYKEIQSQAQAFSMPVFNTERFLYFTGCKSQINKP